MLRERERGGSNAPPVFESFSLPQEPMGVCSYRHLAAAHSNLYTGQKSPDTEFDAGKWRVRELEDREEGRGGTNNETARARERRDTSSGFRQIPICIALPAHLLPVAATAPGNTCDQRLLLSRALNVYDNSKDREAKHRKREPR